MSNPLTRLDHDVSLLNIPKQSPNDPRVPLAEEESLKGRIISQNIRRSRLKKGWLTLPSLSFSQARQLNVSGGVALIPAYPGIIDIDTAITLPAISASGTLSQTHYLYLLGLTAEVGSAQDPILGQLSFDVYNRVTETTTTETKENARRERAFWLLIYSESELTADDFLESLAISGSDRLITISDVSAFGFTQSVGVQVFAVDSNWTQSTYKVFSRSADLIEVCRVRRRQQFTNEGYLWGESTEDALTTPYNLIQNFAPILLEWDKEDWVGLRLHQIFSGKGGVLERTIQNLIAGTTAINPGNPGTPSGSPNNSSNLANDQRVSFSNQATTNQYAVQIVTAANNGEGLPVCTATLNTNSPSGSYFSENIADHRVYAADGTDQTLLGRFQNLGGTGGLIWNGSINSAIAPGQTAYFVPGIVYPSGSGFDVPFSSVESVWKDGNAIATTNIRSSTNDISAYTTPENSEEYIVVLGEERAALHYIYKKISVSSDANGVAVIPGTERGCFAFLEGIEGRIDRPVIDGLTATTAYNALVYYPPRSTETWQIQLRYTQYQGTKEASWLNGAIIASNPIYLGHTQGGGQSCFEGDLSLRHSPIAMHLPAVSSGIRGDRLNTPIQLPNEPYPGASATLRQLPLYAGSNLALPAPGMLLTVDNAATSHDRSITGILKTNGIPLGWRSLRLNNNRIYQNVLIFLAEKGGDYRIVICTYNGSGDEDISLNTDQLAAIDTFRLGFSMNQGDGAIDEVYTNPDLFPDDFVDTGEAPSESEVAIANLQNELVQMAVRNALNKRTTGRAIAITQKEGLTEPSLTLNVMPKLTIVRNTLINNTTINNIKNITNIVPEPDPPEPPAPPRGLEGTKALFPGGWGGSATEMIDRLTYASEILSRSSSSLSQQKFGMTLCTNTYTGYAMGGAGHTLNAIVSGAFGPTDTIEKVVLFSEVRSAVAATLTTGQSFGTHSGGALGDATYGYHMGGAELDDSTGTGIFSQVIQRLTYATEAIATSSATTPDKSSSTACVSTNTIGYELGAWIQPAGVDDAYHRSIQTSNKINKFVYSGEVSSALGTTLQFYRANVTGLSSRTHGYAIAGSSWALGQANIKDAPATNSIEEITYAGEVVSLIGLGLRDSVTGAGGSGNNLMGYIVGGSIGYPASSYKNTIDRFTYDTVSPERIGVTLSSNKGGIKGGWSDFYTGVN